MEVVLHIAFVGWVEVAWLSRPLSINSLQEASKWFFSQTKGKYKLAQWFEHCGQRTFCILLREPGSIWETVRRKKGKSSGTTLKPKAALNHAQESQWPLYWVLAYRGWSKKILLCFELSHK